MASVKSQSMVETPNAEDLHQLLVPTQSETTDATWKTTPPFESRSESNVDSYFIPESLSRTTSIFSFSRASFSSQLANLRSISLPEAESLVAGIADLPTAEKALRSLNQAAEQIQVWTKKAVRVLKNLDAEDDVEWAAAAGKSGLEDTDGCVSDFESLITLYVEAIEELQSREDISSVGHEELQAVVNQMEITLEGWDDVKSGLKSIQSQVELAMEFQELWTSVLGDVGRELDNLSSLVFEMEEKRHMAMHVPPEVELNQTVDLTELENFVGGSSRPKLTPNSRFSLPPAFESSPLGSPMMENPRDDSELLALFARMQPLRASLDFLPMRLLMFHHRAQNIFPHACQQLDDKRERLEQNWAQLSKDAENLRRELSEDRWVVVFRNAGRQAKKMCESVERSVAKLQEAIDGGYQRTNPSLFASRIESFEAKKLHYGPAVQRVLAIIQKGLKERLTVNGEILRLHKDMSRRAQEMMESMEQMELRVDSMNANHNSRLRESISSIVSADRSFSSTTYFDTPHSSPASSVDLPYQRFDPPKSKYGLNGYTKQRKSSGSRPPLPSSARSSLLPQSRRPTTPMSSHSTTTLSRRGVSPSPGLTSVYRQGMYVPPTAHLPSRPAPTPLANKPRWSSTVNVSATNTPAQYRKSTPRSTSTASSVAYHSPLSRETSMSPSPGLPTPLTARRSNQQLRSFAERVASPTPARQAGLMDPLPYHRGRNATAPVAGTIRSPSSLAVHKNSKPTMSSGSHLAPRAPSSLNHTYAPRQSLPFRSISDIPRIPPAPRSEDSAIGSEADQYDDEEEMGIDRTLDHLSPMHRESSSPLGLAKLSPPPHRRNIAVKSTNSRGNRMSMLPVPVGTTGRQSSFGYYRAG